MLSMLKKCLKNIFGFIFNLIKHKDISKTNKSIINSHQKASLGLLLNTYNNINMYNVIIKHKDKKCKIKELEDIKYYLNNYLLHGGINEIDDIKTL